MRINEEQYQKIEYLLPVQRGNVSVNNISFINALLYICENGCKWRRLPAEFGYWHVIYKRFNRWVKDGVIARLFTALAAMEDLNIDLSALKLDSMTVPVHPDGTGALKKPENSQ
jgi:transposase